MPSLYVQEGMEAGERTGGVPPRRSPHLPAQLPQRESGQSGTVSTECPRSLVHY